MRRATQSAIDSLEVIDSTLPRRQLRFVLASAELHQDELRDNWRRARAGETWEHHPLLCPAETYAPSERGVAAHVRDAVGIVRRPAEAPLTPTLRLRWWWRLDALPSKLPEDTTLTHDYLSVALEFDDGQDLSWHWSCALPEGFAYRCPFDHWRRRETHVVVRTGTAGLGRWVYEERPVLADHEAAIGGPVL